MLAIGSSISLLMSGQSRMALSVNMMSGAYHRAWIGLIVLHEKQLLSQFNSIQPKQAVAIDESDNFDWIISSSMSMSTDEGI